MVEQFPRKHLRGKTFFSCAVTEPVHLQARFPGFRAGAGDEFHANKDPARTPKFIICGFDLPDCNQTEAGEFLTRAPGVQATVRAKSPRAKDHGTVILKDIYLIEKQEMTL